MSYDTWKTTPPPEEDSDLCRKCKAGPCECCEMCGVAPDVECATDCPDQLRREVQRRDFTINRQAERITTLEAELQAAREKIDELNGILGDITNTPAVEIERQLREELHAAEDTVEAFAAKIGSLSAHETCACSYDHESDVCAHHSPKLAAAQAEIDRLKEEAKVNLALYAAMDTANAQYEERNAKLVEACEAALAGLPQECSCHPAYTGRQLTDPNCYFCEIDAKAIIEQLKDALASRE